MAMTKPPVMNMMCWCFGNALLSVSRLPEALIMGAALLPVSFHIPDHRISLVVFLAVLRCDSIIHLSNSISFSLHALSLPSSPLLNAVFFMDHWWNPAVEDQAIQRVHRIGQTKEVFVKRYIIKGTVEERMLELKARKRVMTQGVMGGDMEEAKQHRLEDLNLLFQPLD